MKHCKWEGDILFYEIPGAGVARLDTSKLNPEVVKEAARAGFVMTARNATAGLVEDDPKAALERVTHRFARLMSGVWKNPPAEGERGTMLVRAVAEAAGISTKEASKLIEDVIAEKVEEQGLSFDEEADKDEIKKIASAVRKSFAEMPEVVGPLARLRRQAAEKREREAAGAAEKAKAEGNIGTLAELLKR